MPRRRRLASHASLHVLGPSVEHAQRRVVRADDAELGRHDRLLAPSLQRLAEQQLVGAPPVHVRRVEQCHAELERTMDRADRLASSGRAVELGHPHAAESERRDAQAAAAQLALLHAHRPNGPDEIRPLHLSRGRFRSDPYAATRRSAASTTAAALGLAQSSRDGENGIGRSGIATRRARTGPASSTASAITSEA